MLEITIQYIKDVIPSFLYNKYTLSIFVFILFIFLSFIVRFIFHRILLKWTQKTKTNLDDELLPNLEQPLFYSIIIIGVQLSLFVIFKELFFWNILFKILMSFIVLIWFLYIFRIIKILLVFLSSKPYIKFIEKQTLPLFNNLFFIVWILISFYILFSWVWGLDMTALVASMGVAGLALSLAAKDTLANLFAGIFIFADKPYKIGDYIVLNNGQRGKVINIGLRSTRILTRGEVEITVPNSILGSNEVFNESGGRKKMLRLNLPIGVSYDTDIDEMEKILLDIASKNTKVLEDPKPRVRFRNFGASSLDFAFLIWIKDPNEKGLVTHFLLSDIYKQFKKNNIEIPYQKIDININT